MRTLIMLLATSARLVGLGNVIVTRKQHATSRRIRIDTVRRDFGRSAWVVSRRRCLSGSFHHFGIDRPGVAGFGVSFYVAIAHGCFIPGWRNRQTTSSLHRKVPSPEGWAPSSHQSKGLLGARCGGS
jgi:hypothetical protein